MNFHGKDIKIFTGSSNVDVAQGIAGCLGLPLGKSDCTQFSDGEISVSLHESVRGSDCFIVQSTCAPVKDNLMEMLIMIDAMKRASAARIPAYNKRLLSGYPIAPASRNIKGRKFFRPR